VEDERRFTRTDTNNPPVDTMTEGSSSPVHWRSHRVSFNARHRCSATIETRRLVGDRCIKRFSGNSRNKFVENMPVLSLSYQVHRFLTIPHRRLVANPCPHILPKSATVIFCRSVKGIIRNGGLLRTARYSLNIHGTACTGAVSCDRSSVDQRYSGYRPNQPRQCQDRWPWKGR
jgi:hypothetical protein